VGALKYESKGEGKFSIMRDKLSKKRGEGKALLILNIHFIESFMGRNLPIITRPHVLYFKP
jgi:hypothetical protein